MNRKYGDSDYFYANYYEKMLGKDSKGLLRVLWQYPHKVMERTHKGNLGHSILEVGTGVGEHISFVRPDYAKYTALDMDSERLARINPDKKLEIVLGDAESLEFIDSSFERVIATCVVAHLNKPEEALEEWRRVTKPGGSLTIYVPCEPGLMLRIFRFLVTEPKSRRLGFDGYLLFNARDHKNSAHNILQLIQYCFRNDSITMRYRPLYVKSWYLNLFICIEITKS
jgi:phosphatidylethanolamine/phosphatidyl-N-methylethanolamine N-methyltransferase